MRSISSVTLTVLLACEAYAHGSVNSISVGGTQYQGYEPSNSPGTQPKAASGVVWASNDYDIGYVLPTEYNSADIICHKNSSPARKAATVAAGDSISLSWPNWPKTDPHPGVFLNYLAAAGTEDPTKIDKNALKFFKISQFGYDSSVAANGPDKGLATGSFKKAGLVAQVKIPSNIKPGTYVLRHEIIALHEAEQPNKAQNYPQCVTLKVTGGGSATPQGVPGTQLYKATEPGILVKNFYSGFDPKNYKLPGPPVWDGASSSVATSLPASSGASTDVSTKAVVDSSTETTPSDTDQTDDTESVSASGGSSSADDDSQGDDDEDDDTDENSDSNQGKGRKSKGRHRHGAKKWRSQRYRNVDSKERRHPRDLAFV